MRTPRPSALLALPTVAALVLLSGCGTSDVATTSSPTATAPSSPAGSSSAVPTTSPAADVQELTITVSGDSVTGDTGTVAVRVGRPVELTVTSDVADEVHVHGADVSKDVTAGGTVVIDFVQTAPGRFEVELEGRKRVLTRLQVS